MILKRCFLFLFAICLFSKSFGDISLLSNLKKASPGDYIVTYQNKTYTLMHIMEKTKQTIAIQEVSAPNVYIPKRGFSWKDWMKQGAPHNSCWVRYVIDSTTGKMQSYYSVTQKRWLNMTKANNFLSTLLSLRLIHVPYNERKKIASRSNSSDWRNLWQPKMVVEGQTIANTPFEAWKTYWPRDGSELGGKEILVYIPAENDKYPSYFPYWLQVSGLVEKAKIRIIDSGKGMISTDVLKCY